MMFAAVVRFELAYQLRRISIWLCAAAVFALAFLVARSTPAEGEVLNSPYGIAFVTVLTGVVWLLLAASVGGEAAARDIETRMYPLLYTTPIRKSAYLGGRLAAAVLLNAAILLAAPAGFLLSLSLPGVPPEFIGPSRPTDYITIYLLVALPFAVVVTAIQFCWSALANRSRTSYLASVLLLVGSTFLVTTLSALSGIQQLTLLLDLVGIAGIVFYLGDAWTVVELNSRAIGLEGWLQANRLLWIGIAAALFGYTYRHVQLAHIARPRRRWTARPATPPSGTVGSGSAEAATFTVPEVQHTFGVVAYARQTLGIAWASFVAIAVTRSRLLILAIVPLLVFTIVPENLFLLGTPLVPKADYLLPFLTAPITSASTPWVIIPLLTIFHAGELIWRERDARIADMIDATPTPEWVFFLGKYLGLALLTTIWTSLLLAAGVALQAALGSFPSDLGLYLFVLFGLQLPEYLLFAFLALSIQALFDQKHLGLVVALLAYGFIAFADNMGVENHLLVYGSSPNWSYSEMAGFRGSLTPWVWYKLFWAACALLLAIVTRVLWVRGRDTSIVARLGSARRSLTPRTALAATLALATIVSVGGFIGYNTNVRYSRPSDAEQFDLRAEYERRYGQYAGLAQPGLAEVRLRADIYPRASAAALRGTYHLVNNGRSAVDSIHVATSLEAAVRELTFDRPVKVVLVDERLGHRIYVLNQPLLPGDSLQLGFNVHVRSAEFGADGLHRAVVPNGTVLDRSLLPAIGYQEDREITSPVLRRAYGLVARPFLRPLNDAVQREERGSQEGFALDAVIGTDRPQTAVAPGMLQRRWSEGERDYFHYVTDGSIGGFTIVSADYQVREDEWGGVPITLLHHPSHADNSELMLRAARESLDYFSKQFGPYPYRSLVLAEQPGLSLGMQAGPGMILFREGISLLDPNSHRRGADLLFTLVAHEVAHQWWGSHLAPRRVEGNPLLSEGLAEYSALRVLKKTFGPQRMRELIRSQQLSDAETPRPRADVPLLQANSDYHEYRKGPRALNALSEYVGEENVNLALRRLLDTYESGSLVTTLDLYRELRAVTPDSLQYFVHDLLAANTFWQLEIRSATATESGPGEWRVTFNVRSRKLVVDTIGAEVEVPMDDLVEVGVFAPAAGEGATDTLVYLRQHRLRAGEQTISVTVPERPARVGVDPRHLLVEEKTKDNMAETTRS